MKKMMLNYQIMQLKITLKMRKSIIHQKKNKNKSNDENAHKIHQKKRRIEIVKLVRETSKDTKLCFFSIVCRNDIKDIDREINEINSHLENYF